VRDVKQRVGLDSFWTLPDYVEARMEDAVDGALVRALLVKCVCGEGIRPESGATVSGEYSLCTLCSFRSE